MPDEITPADAAYDPIRDAFVLSFPPDQSNRIIDIIRMQRAVGVQEGRRAAVDHMLSWWTDTQEKTLSECAEEARTGIILK